MSKKTVVALLTVVLSLVFIAGCGNPRKELCGEWELIDRSSTGSCIFPTQVPNMCINGYDFCKMELMSDGSIVVEAGVNDYGDISSDKCKFDVVDGKLKIDAPLGSSAFSDYEIKHNSLIITDKKGNTVEFKRK